MLGLSKSQGTKIAQRLERQGDDVSGLITAARDEKLKAVIDNFMGKGAKLKKIKGSDALGAAKLYADRRYPVRQEGDSGKTTLIQVNLNVLGAPGAVSGSSQGFGPVVEVGGERLPENVSLPPLGDSGADLRPVMQSETVGFGTSAKDEGN